MIFILPPAVDSPLFGDAARGSASWPDENLLKPEKMTASDGYIYILDRGDETIKRFTPGGRLEKTIGGKGQGPGEFIAAISFAVNASRLFVLDSMSERIHIFSKPSLKFIESKRLTGIPDVGAAYDAAAADSGVLFIARNTGIKGETLITRVSPDMKPTGAFLECVPAYENQKDFMNQPDPSKVQLKDFWNQGILYLSGENLYFVFSLLNRVERFDARGRKQASLALPSASLQQTGKIRYFQNGAAQPEQMLNYDIAVHQGRPAVLSRSPQGQSVLFILTNNRWSPQATFNQKLVRMAILDQKLYGLDENENRVYVFPL